jgi:hypothetical protein
VYAHVQACCGTCTHMCRHVAYSEMLRMSTLNLTGLPSTHQPTNETSLDLERHIQICFRLNKTDISIKRTIPPTHPLLSIFTVQLTNRSSFNSSLSKLAWPNTETDLHIQTSYTSIHHSGDQNSRVLGTAQLDTLSY